MVEEQFRALLCGHPHTLSRTDQALDAAVRVSDHMEGGLQYIPNGQLLSLTLGHHTVIKITYMEIDFTLSMKRISEIKQN